VKYPVTSGWGGDKSNRGAEYDQSVLYACIEIRQRDSSHCITGATGRKEKKPVTKDDSMIILHEMPRISKSIENEHRSAGVGIWERGNEK
jgi:hypothetical protein